MAKYKIVYDREGCIGVGSCALLALKFWKMTPENDKADLLGAKKRKDGKWELIIDENDFFVNTEAARNCPVNVIKIYDESGKEAC